MKSQRLILTVLILFAAFQICFGQETLTENSLRFWNNGILLYWVFSENIPDKEMLEIKKRWDDIGESLKTTKNLFAGTYFTDGGYYLRWSPEEGFVYVSYHEYRVTDASYGKVSATESDVKFIVEREMQNFFNGKFLTSTDWIPAYKNQLYFIRKNEIKSFGDFYGGFGVFSAFPLLWHCDCGPFAIRVDKGFDNNKLKEFIVPSKYLKFIKYSLTGKIISVGKRYVAKNHIMSELYRDGTTSITPVTIDVGQKDKVKRGVLFTTDNNDGFIEVIRVGKNSSQAIFVREIDAKGNEAYLDDYDNNGNPIYKPYPPIRIGTKISTDITDEYNKINDL